MVYAERVGYPRALLFERGRENIYSYIVQAVVKWSQRDVPYIPDAADVALQFVGSGLRDAGGLDILYVEFGANAPQHSRL
eukprot:9481687-Pyramimonas_sp.AAC.2